MFRRCSRLRGHDNWDVRSLDPEEGWLCQTRTPVPLGVSPVGEPLTDFEGFVLEDIRVKIKTKSGVRTQV